MYMYKLHTISHTKINLGGVAICSTKSRLSQSVACSGIYAGPGCIIVVLESIHVYHCFKLLCHHSIRTTCTCIYMYAVSFGGTCSSSRVRMTKWSHDYTSDLNSAL